MPIGAHVSSSGSLLAALDRGEKMGADAIQIFTQSPRMWRPPAHSDESLAAYRIAQGQHATVHATFCHATYLINLATGDDELLAKSRTCLEQNLLAATALGARGLVLHVGSHRGGGLDAVIGQIADVITSSLDHVATTLETTPCALLLENAAGAGGTVGRDFEELALLIEACGNDVRLGVCLDTQHLFASGVDYSNIELADQFVARLDRVLGIDRLGCIHLNDSKVPFGANRDRHENIGEGAIGKSALGALISHPSLLETYALLEVPGEGDGPRSIDIDAAREALNDGIAARRAVN